MLNDLTRIGRSRAALLWAWATVLSCLPLVASGSLVPLQWPPAPLCLSCAALAAGRVLGAADRVSAERCRRAMVVAGVVSTALLAALESALLFCWVAWPAVAAEGCMLSVSLVGWICLAYREGSPEPPHALAATLAFAFLFPLALGWAGRSLGVPVAAALALVALCAAALAPSAAGGRGGSGLSDRGLITLFVGLLASSSMVPRGGSAPDPLMAIATCALLAAPLLTALRGRGGADPPVEAVLASRASRPLSARELEVLALTVRGGTRGQISALLGVSESTVGTNRCRGYEKLGVRSKGELLALVSESEGEAGDVSYGEAPPPHPSAVLVLSVSACALAADGLLAEPARGIAAGLIGLALVCYAASLALRFPDSGGGGALRRETGLPPAWGRALSSLLCATLLPAAAVSSWSLGPAPLLQAALMAFLALAHLGSSPALPDPAETPPERLGRVLGRGVRELSCRSQELLGIAGLVALSHGAIGRLVGERPGLADGAWLLMVPYAVLAFGGVFGSQSPAPGDAAGARVALVSYLRSRGLNELQSEIALAVARGEGEGQICERLHVARGTVKSYRNRAYRALGVHTAFELRERLLSGAGVTGFDESNFRGRQTRGTPPAS